MSPLPQSSLSVFIAASVVFLFVSCFPGHGQPQQLLLLNPSCLNDASLPFWVLTHHCKHSQYNPRTVLSYYKCCFILKCYLLCVFSTVFTSCLCLLHPNHTNQLCLKKLPLGWCSVLMRGAEDNRNVAEILCWSSSHINQTDNGDFKLT